MTTPWHPLLSQSLKPARIYPGIHCVRCRHKTGRMCDITHKLLTQSVVTCGQAGWHASGIEGIPEVPHVQLEDEENPYGA
jgi:hypothetical protein